jgi:ribonuclease P protein component
MSFAAAAEKGVIAYRRPMNRQGLARHERIRTRSEFKELFDKDTTKSYASGMYRILLRRNALPYSRLGVVVSKRLGGAVVRNRQKRLVREMFRRHKDEIPRGYDFIVIVRAIKDVSFSERVSTFLSLMHRVR